MAKGDQYLQVNKFKSVSCFVASQNYELKYTRLIVYKIRNGYFKRKSCTRNGLKNCIDSFPICVMNFFLFQ